MQCAIRACRVGIAGTVAASLLLAATPSSNANAQTVMARSRSPVHRMLALARRGEFATAAALGESSLDELPSSRPLDADACHLVLTTGYVAIRAGNRDQASRAVTAYLSRCERNGAPPPANAPEVLRIRRVLAGAPVSAVYKPIASPAARGDAGSRTAPPPPIALSAGGPGSAPAAAVWDNASAGPNRRAATAYIEGDPVALGLDTSALARHRELCIDSSADACLVLYRGQIVQEWYGRRYREPMPAMSSTKSIAGLLVGMLIDDGKLSGVDVRVCTYLPDWCTGTRVHVTIRHLLTMTSGFPTMQDARSVSGATDQNAHVRALTPTSEPGEVWAYSNEGVQLLSPILDVVAGEPIQSYAKRRLFEPLGMVSTQLSVDAAGHAVLYSNMQTTPREFARIGLLMLRHGAWQGKQIVSQRWVASSVVASQALNREYGLLWWTAMPNESRFASRGYLDTDMQVMPDDQLVIVRMQRATGPVGVRAAYAPAAYDIYPEFVRRLGGRVP